MAVTVKTFPFLRNCLTVFFKKESQSLLYIYCYNICYWYVTVTATLHELGKKALSSEIPYDMFMLAKYSWQVNYFSPNSLNLAFNSQKRGPRLV